MTTETVLAVTDANRYSDEVNSRVLVTCNGCGGEFAYKPGSRETAFAWLVVRGHGRTCQGPSLR